MLLTVLFLMNRYPLNSCCSFFSDISDNLYPLTDRMSVLNFLKNFELVSATKSFTHRSYFKLILEIEVIVSKTDFTLSDFSGDLFDVLLPMLNIYQEFVRNHHFSLQILTECKQNPQFSSVLTRLEEHSVCQGRSLETFLTFPMHQVMDSNLLKVFN